jgi:precorrin-3B synthase
LVQDVAEALRRLIRWFMPQGVVDGRGRMAGLAGSTLPAGFDHPMNRHDFAATPGRHPLGLLVALEFGQIRAKTLLALATTAVRITPWRMMLLCGVKTPPVLAGLITDAADPRLRVTACTGAPSCPQGLQPTRDLARRLAASVPRDQHLHVSGCAKGCAHSGPADATLVGTRAGYDLIRQGRAMDPGTAFDPETPLFKVL